MKYVVTHGGDCHWDEMLAAGFALYRFGREIPIFRRQPTDKELDDPSVLILDVGGRYEPEKNNYDHHQLPPEQLECALTLFLRHEMPEEFELLKRGSSLLDIVARMDNLGPMKFQAGSDRPVNMTVLEPLDAPIRRLFEVPEPASAVREFLRVIAEEHLKTAAATAEAIGLVEKAVRMNIDGIQVIYSNVEHPKFKHVLDSIKKEPYDVLVLPDNRGPGWMLFRNNDHPRVDFTRVANDPRVSFAHKNGFIAKTKERLGDEEVFELLRRAIK